VRIALFGQAAFGRDCLDRLIESGHSIAGVLTPPEGGRRDPLALRAEELALPLVQRRHYRKRSGEAIRAAVEAHRELGAELNVLAFVTAILPPEIVFGPKRGSICFHPSLLPRFRGGSALAWQVILGEQESGVTVFVPDEGVDTGPVVVQKGGVRIEPGDTAGSLYFEKLYSLGVDAIAEAVDAIASGEARPLPQDEARATFQGLVDDAVAGIDLERPADEIDRLVRGCDPQPGAFLRLEAEPVRLYDAGLEPAVDAPPGSLVSIDERGLRIALRGGSLRVGRVRADGAKEQGAAFAARRGLRAGDRLESA
jgi:methionyl-tRNA formyltransferase